MNNEEMELFCYLQDDEDYENDFEQDYKRLLREDIPTLFDYIKKKDKEIARLNKIIEEIETIFDTPYFDDEVSKQLGDNGFFTFKQMYEACNIVFKKRLKELKEEGKNKC